VVGVPGCLSAVTSLTGLPGMRDVPGESIVPKMQVSPHKFIAITLDQRGEAWCNLRPRTATVHAVQSEASRRDCRCRVGPGRESQPATGREPR
jgi:hypothetical protein